MIVGCEGKMDNRGDTTDIVKQVEQNTSFVESGIASYYADRFHGKRTASGEPYDREALTAAHPTLPFGTQVRITELKNSKNVIVTINDRGPHTKNRVIDLSYRAAKSIGLIKAGVTKVKVETLSAIN
jgi:rare lipoprotein A